jgi:hypothetical protein
MLRAKVIFSFLCCLVAWHDVQEDTTVVPSDHPTNPYARPAPPIVVPPVQGPDLKGAYPDLSKQQDTLGRERQPASTGGGAIHQHHH